MSSLRRFTFGSGTVDYNFDVTANWAANGVTSEATFISFMNSKQYQPNLLISSFSLVDNRLRMAFTGNNSLDLTGMNVTDYQRGASGFNENGLQNLFLQFNAITIFDPIEPCPTNLINLNLAGNQITHINTDKINYLIRNINVAGNSLTSFTLNRSLPNLIELFLGGNRLNSLNITAVQPNLYYLDLSNGNGFSTFEYGHLFPKLELLQFSSQLFTKFAPVIPLSNTINTILLNGCRFTTQGYIDSEPWANSLTVRPGRGTINLEDNPTSAISTNFKTILESKGFTVLAN